MKTIFNFIKLVVKKINEDEFYFLLFIMAIPYFIGFPIWYWNTDRTYNFLVEVFAPWFVGLISLSVIPFTVVIFLIVTWPFNFIRNFFNKQKKN
jgi:hypothetical protein